jgi:TPR repeat protein
LIEELKVASSENQINFIKEIERLRPSEIAARILKQLKNGDYANFDMLLRLKAFYEALPGDIESKKIKALLKRFIEESEIETRDNNPTAMNNLGLFYRLGFGVPQDYNKAIELYERAIALGNADAMSDRAYMHEEGERSAQDYNKAIALYERAIALGNASAMNNRAWMHLQGRGGPQDYAKAIVLCDRAIALGDANAMNNSAWMHKHGQGGLQDYNKAIELYDRAIALGDADAMNSRARMHVQGQGGAQDYAKAIVLYDWAIALGDVEVMNNRAKMHQHGKGGPKNDTVAARLYRKAATKGALKNLNAGQENIYRYHAAMYEGNVYKVALLLLDDDVLIDEFIVYDCIKAVTNPAHLEVVENVVAALSGIGDQASLSPTNLVKLILTMEQEQREQGIFTQALTNFKLGYLKEIKLTEFKPNLLVPMLALIVDEWWQIESGFTALAAEKISQLMHLIKAHGLEQQAEPLFKTSALILIQAIYGDKKEVTLSDIDSQHIMMLVAVFEGKSKPDASVLNALFGKDVIVTKFVKDKQAGEASSASAPLANNISDGSARFFTNNNEQEDKSKLPEKKQQL